jgi:hypothetical protein
MNQPTRPRVRTDPPGPSTPATSHPDQDESALVESQRRPARAEPEAQEKHDTIPAPPPWFAEK